jgi:hypothetical protein
LRQHFARGLGFLGESRRRDREALAPLARRAEIDMDEAGAWVEAETEEADCAYAARVIIFLPTSTPNSSHSTHATARPAGCGCHAR